MSASSDSVNSVVGGGLFTVFTYCGESCVCSVFRGDTFNSIVSRLCLRWSSLKADSISLSYSLPEFPNCLLKNDEDVRNMVGISYSSGIQRLRVDVVRDNDPSVKATEFELIDDGDVDIVDAEADLLPTFCPRDSNTLLTLGWKDLITGVDQVFYGGASEFRVSLKKMCIESGYPFKFVKNDCKRITVECLKKTETGCSWMIHASQDAANLFFYVRTMEKVHTCGSSSRSLAGARTSSNLVADLVRDEIRCNPGTRPILVKKRMLLSYGLVVSYTNAWNGVDKAKTSLYGSVVESYNGIIDYVKSIHATNPGSYVYLEVHEQTNRFRRLFVAFGGCIRGFNHIRPMLFLDGSHLKTQFKGHVLSAVGKDGNQGLFPLCFAFVDAEDGDNWLWFLTHLKEILDPNRSITFITDRHSGLVAGIPALFPNGFHSFCIYHLQLNLRAHCAANRKGGKLFKKRMLFLLRACAYAPTIELFNLNMDKILLEANDNVKDFFKGIPVKNWATAHFKGMRYGEMASSAVESFNNWILEERHLPICKMLDAIQIKMMKQMSDRKIKAAGWNSLLCPRVDKSLGECIDVCRTWNIVQASDHVYEVFSARTCTVDLVKFTCSCMRWQLYGFPCAHAVLCILRSNRRLHDFVDPGYLSKTYAASYNVGLYPIATMYQVGSSSGISNFSCVIPPSTKRPPGRPKKLRIASTGEFKRQKRQMRCGRCGVLGSHNKTTCVAPVAFK